MNIINDNCRNPYCECVMEKVSCRNIGLFNDPDALDYVVGDTSYLKPESLFMCDECDWTGYLRNHPGRCIRCNSIHCFNYGY